MRIVPWCCFVLVVAGYAAADQGRPVTYHVNEKPYSGYYVDAGKGAALIVLIHDWDGLGDYEMKRSRMLAEKGYSVFAADLFGANVRPTKPEDRKKLTGELYKDREKMRALMLGAFRAARNLGADSTNVVAMGYCFGGTAVLELARTGILLRGFVSFHGGLEIPEGQDYSTTKGKILVFHGTADKSITMGHFADLAQALESTKIDHEMITYGRADHAFSVFGGDRYNEAADVASWQRFLLFLETTLKR